MCERRFGDYLSDAPQMRTMRPAAAPSEVRHQALDAGSVSNDAGLLSVHIVKHANAGFGAAGWHTDCTGGFSIHGK